MKIIIVSIETVRRLIHLPTQSHSPRSLTTLFRSRSLPSLRSSSLPYSDSVTLLLREIDLHVGT